MGSQANKSQPQTPSKNEILTANRLKIKLLTLMLSKVPPQKTKTQAQYKIIDKLVHASMDKE
jgi:hypothetical protein